MTSFSLIEQIVRKLGEAMVRLFQGIEKYMDEVPESLWEKVINCRACCYCY